MKRLLFVAVLVCLTAACGVASAARAIYATQASASAAQMDKSAQVDSLVASLVQGNGPGLAVMVIEDGKIVHSKGYGLARLDTKEPVGQNTAFDLGSTSKQFTAMAIMLLVGEGKLSYDDPLSKFFPEFPSYAKNITVRHLLNHTSGLRDVINPRWFRKDYEPTSRELLKMLVSEQSAQFKSGERFEYNNSGYVLLSLIVEKASGQSFARFMREKIFKPLGMNSTAIFDETKPKIQHMATSYFLEGGSFRPFVTTSDVFLYGAKGVFSTTEDLYKWDQALETGKLVKPPALKEAFTSARLNNGTNTQYGFGWYIVEDNGLRVVEHAGGYLGYRAAIRRYPDERATIIVLSNNATVEAAPLARKIAQVYLAEKMKPPTAVKIDSSLWRDYVGKYEGDPSVMPNLVIEITLEGDELYITSPIRPKTKLLAQTATEFQIAETAAKVTFERDDKGSVTSLSLLTRRGIIKARKLTATQ